MPRGIATWFTVAVCSAALSLAGCSTGAMIGIGNAGADIARGLGAGTVGTGTTKFYIFGGPSHQTYLGCLNCSQYTTDSVFNEYGRNGSRYSQTSIWNRYSQFGSPYSLYRACNQYATDPPVIVDHDGNYYGRLTLNTYHRQIGVGVRLQGWLTRSVCAD